MSPHLCCGDICQIWTWHSIDNQYYDNWGNWLSNPTLLSPVFYIYCNVTTYMSGNGKWKICEDLWLYVVFISLYNLIINFDDWYTLRTQYVPMCYHLYGIAAMLWRPVKKWSWLQIRDGSTLAPFANLCVTDILNFQPLRSGESRPYFYNDTVTVIFNIYHEFS